MIFCTLTLEGQKLQNLEKLPAFYKVHGNIYYAWALLAFAIIFGSEAFYVLAINFRNILSQDIKHLVFAPMAFLFLFWSFDQFFKKGTLIIKNGQVICSYKTILGRKKWSESVNKYQGIKKKIEKGQGNAIGSRQLYYAIWLKHREKSKSIRLSKSWSSDGWDTQQQIYSKLLGVECI